MTVPIIAYLSPVFIALIIPVIMPFNASGLKSYAIRTGIVTAGLIVIIGALNWAMTHGPFYLTAVSLLGLAAFLISWSMMISGLLYLLASLRLGLILAQVIIYAIVLIIHSRIFWANPLIETFAANMAIRQLVIKILVATTPFLTIASNFFQNDILRSTKMYTISIIGPYYSYGYADWRIVSLIYCLIGSMCYVIGHYSSTVSDRGTSQPTMPGCNSLPLKRSGCKNRNTTI